MIYKQKIKQKNSQTTDLWQYIYYVNSIII